MRFSEIIMQVEPSATLAITSKAKALVAAGEDVIVLAAGEPDSDTPKVIKDAAIDAIKKGFTRYTPASGTKSLKEAVCRKLLDDNGLSYTANDIVISCGAKHSLYNVLRVICNPQDEVIVISPFWLSYPEMVKLAGATPKILKTTAASGFKAMPEDIKALITDKTRALILNSPSNPAGVVYEEAELKAIADICVSSNVTIISDEIYEKIIFDGKKHVSIASVSAEAKANTIVINGVSKSHSMTGWRIGYMAADAKIAGLVSTLQSQSTSNPCSISQAASECALMSDLKKEMDESSSKFEDRRNKLFDLLSGVKKITPFKPEGAFYMFCDISETGIDSITFAKKLLEEKKVAVIPGGPFGEDGFIRISFATDMATIIKGVERIKEFISEL